MVIGIHGKMSQTDPTTIKALRRLFSQQTFSKLLETKETQVSTELNVHNCQKTHKLVTFLHSLIEHPMFIMYMVKIHSKNKKVEEKKCLIFFTTLLGFVPTTSELQAVWARFSPNLCKFLAL